MESFFTIRTVMWEDGRVKMIDQAALPGRLTYAYCDTWQGVADSIRRMVIRGAPAIGVAAAMAIALSAAKSRTRDMVAFKAELEIAAAGLRATRPTAVNLFWAIDRVMRIVASGTDIESIKTALMSESLKMAEEDVEANRRLGRFGADLLEDGDTVITQCNAGALATVGYGTALGVVRAATEQGKCIKVIVPETRPALQGARLTAFELARDGIPCTLIADTAVGHMMQSGRVDKAVVGADRVTKDGFVFNKIGTYQVAVLADRHSVPFYPAAPSSSFDLEKSHEEVTIEERAPEEVFSVRGTRIAPRGVPVANPAFDMTPPELITAIVSDKGLIRRPVQNSIASVIRY